MRACSGRLIVTTLAAVFALLTATPPALPQSARQEHEHLIGTWNLVVAKSKYRPGPAPKSEVRTYTRERDGMRGSIRRLYPDGRLEVIEYRADFNHEYPVSGTDAYDAVKFRRLDAHTAEAVLSHAGNVFGVARREIASDGKTMTIAFRRENPTVIVQNFAYYEKAHD
jgi:hypothetical protein